MANILGFRCEQADGGQAALVPLVDGVSLADRVAAFEHAKGYDDPAGGYGGLVLSRDHLTRLPSHFLGQDRAIARDRPGEIHVLSCECGDAGCWPLFVHVGLAGGSVTWERFRQPHRPKRDYSDFGPFAFERAQYEAAVAAAARLIDAG